MSINPQVSFADIEQQHGWPAGLLDSMWYQESSRGQRMLSPANAKGHFQFRLAARDEVAGETGLDAWSADPREAAKSAAHYLAKQQRRFGGDLSKALAAYNAGPGRVEDAIRDHGDNWLAHLREETQNYGQQILGRIGLASKGIYLGARQHYATRRQEHQTSTEEDAAELETRRGNLIALGINPELVEKLGSNILTDVFFNFVDICIKCFNLVSNLASSSAATPPVVMGSVRRVQASPLISA